MPEQIQAAATGPMRQTDPPKGRAHDRGQIIGRDERLERRAMPNEDLTGGARWSPDGRELFYVSADRYLMAVPVRTTPKLEVGRATRLFELEGHAWTDFDISADGKRFLAGVPQSFAGEQPLTVILNWAAEGRR